MAKKIPVTTDALCCGSVVDAPLEEDEAVELARGLGALADPVRLRSLSLVAQKQICPCDLEAAREEFGVGLAAAIIIDAVAVPALRHPFGPFNWWLPRWLDRWLSVLHIDSEAETHDGAGRSSTDPVTLRGTQPGTTQDGKSGRHVDIDTITVDPAGPTRQRRPMR
jgi:ArsR family transcriptional regulator, arsenate/arsenite/antimonite-responsive transcriptional repressor